MYGWLSENVVSADVVMPGGDLRTVEGDERRSVVGPEGAGGIVGRGGRLLPSAD